MRLLVTEPMIYKNNMSRKVNISPWLWIVLFIAVILLGIRGNLMLSSRYTNTGKCEGDVAKIIISESRLQSFTSAGFPFGVWSSGPMSSTWRTLNFDEGREATLHTVKFKRGDAEYFITAIYFMSNKSVEVYLVTDADCYWQPTDGQSVRITDRNNTFSFTHTSESGTVAGQFTAMLLPWHRLSQSDGPKGPSERNQNIRKTDEAHEPSYIDQSK